MRRIVDIAISSVALLLVSPLLVAVALAIKLSSPGPVLYRARRVGRGRQTFDMLKFRSMTRKSGGPIITAHDDPRVFPVGRFIRRTKLDELPQFINVLRGEMAIVGPRPEDPAIVRDFYTGWMLETLDVRPGMTSPGAIFYYSHIEHTLSGPETERDYVERVLVPKLAIERGYMEKATVASDMCVMVRTFGILIRKALGRPLPISQKDIDAARVWLDR